MYCYCRKEPSYPAELRLNYENYIDGYITNSLGNYCCEQHCKTGPTPCSCPVMWKDMDSNEESSVPHLTKSANTTTACKQVELRVMINPQDNAPSVYSKIGEMLLILDIFAQHYVY